MSRFNDNESDDPLVYGRWQGAVKASLFSAPGLARLRDLEAALVDLPTPRLISGRLAWADYNVWLYDPADPWLDYYAEQEELWPRWRAKPPGVEFGDVCLVGAYCAYKMAQASGHAVPRVLAVANAAAGFLDANGWDEHDRSDSLTAEIGQRYGLTYSLAWQLGYMNDEDWWRDTPEERYAHALTWTRHKIVEVTRWLALDPADRVKLRHDKYAPPTQPNWFPALGAQQPMGGLT